MLSYRSYIIYDIHKTDRIEICTGAPRNNMYSVEHTTNYSQQVNNIDVNRRSMQQLQFA